MTFTSVGAEEMVVAVAVSEAGPSLSPVLVAITRTVYSTPPARFSMVWVTVAPPSISAWRVASQSSVLDFHCTL